MKAVALSAFIDRNGLFAKEPEQLHHVNIQFEDGDTVTLTADEFNSLSVENQDAIRNAGALGQEVQL